MMIKPKIKKLKQELLRIRLKEQELKIEEEHIHRTSMMIIKIMIGLMAIILIIKL